MLKRIIFTGCCLVVISTSVGAAEPLTLAQARITVTGHDVNPPDSFPGWGGFSWPGNIVRMPDGELLLVHSAGYYHVSFAEPRQIEPMLRERWLREGWPLDFPAPTGGRSMLVRSRDGGRTWTKPTTLIDLPLDDSPCGLIRTADGTLLCFLNVQASWYGYDRVPAVFRHDLGGRNTQQCVVRSTDGGRSWSPPIWIETPGSYLERSHTQPLVLPSGRVLFPLCYTRPSDSKWYGAIHASDDSGRSWRLLVRIARSGDRVETTNFDADARLLANRNSDGDTSDTASAQSSNIDEPALARLPDGRLFLITRPDGGYFLSDDEGRSWSFGGRLVTQGKFKAPRLFVLQDGTIVCVCTYRSLQAFVGRDGGKQWTGPFDLDPAHYGYPGGLLLKDDSMLVSYCSAGGAPNRIHLLRFRVNDARDGVSLLPVAATLD